MRYPIDCLRVAILSLSLPIIANASHYRWGRTDATVAEPGAYIAAVILTPLVLLAVLFIFLAASGESVVREEAPPAFEVLLHRDCRNAFAILERQYGSLMQLF